MARARKPTTADIDWYLISIDRLKQIGIGLLVLVAIGFGYYFFWQSKNPKNSAESRIADAQSALNELAGSKDFNKFRAEFDKARKRLDEAKGLFVKTQYAEAEVAAVDSQTIVKTALAKLGDRDSDAQFLTVEGAVEYQKSNNSDWKKADPRTPLFNGDWVKTGAASSAELIFSNGSIYTIGPNALLEVYSVFNPATSKKDNSVDIKYGPLEVNTSEESSTVRSPSAQVVVNSDSTTQVAVEKDKGTQVVSLKGQASVAPKSGGPAITLATNEQVSSTSSGTLSEKTTVAPPPTLISPGENENFQLGDLVVDFAWQPQAPARAYQLQVSRSRLFASLEIDARRQDTRARAKVTSQGSFYWRVASIDATGKVGPYSTFRSFRVRGTKTAETQQQPVPGVADKVPPKLVVSKPFNIGGEFYMIEGVAEPGATAYINDEEVTVEANGAFKKLVGLTKVGLNEVVIKAVDAAGNQSTERLTVVVEQ